MNGPEQTDIDHGVTEIVCRECGTSPRLKSLNKNAGTQVMCDCDEGAKKSLDSVPYEYAVHHMPDDWEVVEDDDDGDDDLPDDQRVLPDGGQPSAGSERSSFPFEEGDTVLVRAREAGTAGNIVAKFEANCIDITDKSGIGTSPKARFNMPLGTMNSVSIRPYEAEFEVIDDD